MGVTNLRISQEVKVPLENLAQRLDRSKNYLINQTIKEFLARQMMEDSRWEDTLAALGSVKEGKLVDEANVTEWLQSWGTDKELSPPQKKMKISYTPEAIADLSRLRECRQLYDSVSHKRRRVNCIKVVAWQRN